MQKEGKLFDDLARVASGAMSSFGALRDEAVDVTAQFIWSPGLDLPGRVAAACLQEEQR